MGPDAQSLKLAELQRENEILRRECARYRALAPYDGATGLLRRDHFAIRLHHEWARAERFWNALSLIAFDATALAPHAAALSDAGRVVASLCRDVDIAGWTASDWAGSNWASSDWAGSDWAGAGFALILPSTNRTGAEAELRRLAAADTRIAALGAGISVAFDDANTPGELLLIAARAARPVAPRCDDQPTLHHGAKTWIDAPWEPETIPCRPAGPSGLRA